MKSWIFLTILFNIFIPCISSNTYTFFSIGDWGSAAIGGQHLKNVKTISNQMYNYSTIYNPLFIFNTGDNFYYCGIQDLHDYQVNTDYISLFNDMNIDWYNTLGNHDYGYNVSAQLEISTINKHWIMDDRYYLRKIKINEKLFIYSIFIDSNPCVYDYIQDNPKYWDPCGTEYPTCSLNDINDDDFEGECKFHENILSQNCSEQYEWFSETLNELYSEKIDNKKLNISTWIIVVGHHPVYEITEAPFYKLIDLYVDLYLNGHQHLLNHYRINNKNKYMTTGAGGMVSVSQHNTLSRNIIPSLRNSINTYVHHSIIWQNRIAGFTIHEFINNGVNLTTKFIKYDGSVIYEFTL